jgi:hypothetical protein
MKGFCHSTPISMQFAVSAPMLCTTFDSVPNQPASKLSEHQHLNTLNSNAICKRVIVILNTQTAHHKDHHSRVSVFCPDQHISVCGLHCRALWMCNYGRWGIFGSERIANVASYSQGFDYKQCSLPRCYLLPFYRVDSKQNPPLSRPGLLN